MASKAVVAPQQLKGEVKQKEFVGDGKNRRVLQDIGNLVNGRPVLGKKPIPEPGKVAARKKVEKQVAEAVIVISCDDESENTKAVSTTTSKQIKTLTSILTARSKIASGENSPENIDANDADNELAAVEYVDEIYKYYKQAEGDLGVNDYMKVQNDINAKMRSILVDWLIEVHRKFELMPETLYLTVSIIDRYLSMKGVYRRELQLVGISSMLIACKYEEIWAPEVNDFICISDNAYIREQILTMEKAILGKLEWYLTIPTPYVFLVRYIKASIPADDEIENMVHFLAELGLMQYPVMITYSPSLVAASAVYAARCTLDKKPFWTETLKHQTGYPEDMLLDCAKALVESHAAIAKSKLKAVYKKFSNVNRGAVALFSPAKSLAESS